MEGEGTTAYGWADDDGRYRRKNRVHEPRARALNKVFVISA